MTDPVPTPDAALEAVGARLPGASVHAWHDDRIDGTHYTIALRLGVAFDVSDESAFRSPLAVESGFRKAIVTLERDALERHLAAAVADSRREDAARIARAEDRIDRARRILADYIIRPTAGDREVIIARLAEVLR